MKNKNDNKAISQETMKNYAAFAISLIGVGSIDPILLKMLIAVKVLQASPK